MCHSSLETAKTREGRERVAAIELIVKNEEGNWGSCSHGYKQVDAFSRQRGTCERTRRAAPQHLNPVLYVYMIRTHIA